MKKEITRATSFIAIVVVIFAILVARLFYIQVIKGDYYESLAEEKGQKEIVNPAPRGDILDRKGQKIATSKQGYNITFSNYKNKSKEKAEVTNKRINTTLIETLKIVNANGNADKLNLSSVSIALEGDKYVYNFTATSQQLRAKLESNLKKAYGIDKIEENRQKETGDKTFKFDANGVVTELGKKFQLLDKDTGSNTYNLSKLELLQLVSLRAAINDVGYSQYKTVYIAKNIAETTAYSLMAKGDELPGIEIEVAPIRDYPFDEVGSAFLGYLGKIDENSKDEYKALGYDLNRELIGKLGLEKALENNKDMGISLRGEPGVKYVNVDKFGKITKETATLDPIPGDNVKTTIDIDLQKVAEEALDSTMKNIRGKSGGGRATRGAAIVTEVETGEVLALASRPGYDPNLFAETGSLADPEVYKKYFVPEKNEGDKYDTIPAPMFNYATKGAVPPGSIFKPFVAIAGLEEGVITPTSTFYCNGTYGRVKGFSGGCWIKKSGGSHGSINVSQALEVSCNIFFYDTGRFLGYEKFTKWAARFGLAANPETGEKPKSGIEIEESPGQAGSPERYKQTNLAIYMNRVINKISAIDYGGYTITKGTEEYKTLEDMFNVGEYDKAKIESIGIINTKAQKYIRSQVIDFRNNANNVGELLNVSIGQGSTMLTPLQMVGAINTLLNDGKRYATHLVKEVLNQDGTVKREIKPELLDEFTIKPESKAAVIKGMSDVTKGDHGTAASTFRNFKIPSGGKTGSAQVSDTQKAAGRSATGWFMGFAPLNNPKISVVVVIYDAESGSYTAPVAKAIYEEYFKDELNGGKSNDSDENNDSNNAQTNTNGTNTNQENTGNSENRTENQR